MVLYFNNSFDVICKIKTRDNLENIFVKSFTFCFKKKAFKTKHPFGDEVDKDFLKIFHFLSFLFVFFDIINH